MIKPKKEEIERIKELIEPAKEKEIVKIVYDNKQWSVRIPSKFVESAQLNLKKDKFEFRLTLPSITDKDNKPKLEGRLIRG